jgi:hypothetical protein
MLSVSTDIIRCVADGRQEIAITTYVVFTWYLQGIYVPINNVFDRIRNAPVDPLPVMKYVILRNVSTGLSGAPYRLQQLPRQE